jgi:hypothetical protein
MPESPLLLLWLGSSSAADKPFRLGWEKQASARHPFLFAGGYTGVCCATGCEKRVLRVGVAVLLYAVRSMLCDPTYHTMVEEERAGPVDGDVHSPARLAARCADEIRLSCLYESNEGVLCILFALMLRELELCIASFIVARPLKMSSTYYTHIRFFSTRAFVLWPSLSRRQQRGRDLV